MRTNNFTDLFVLIILLLVCLGAAFIANLPPPARPAISITLLGYTNDVTGERLAKFFISNQAPSMVQLRIQGSLGPQITRSVLLERGAGFNCPIPSPTDAVPWRLLVEADPDIGWARDLQHIMSRTVRRHPYMIYGDWITNTP